MGFWREIKDLGKELLILLVQNGQAHVEAIEEYKDQFANMSDESLNRNAHMGSIDRRVAAASTLRDRGYFDKDAEE